MSTSSYVHLYNANHPKIVAAKATPETLAEWEDDNGPLAWIPGVEVEDKNDAIEWTDEEYDGIIVDVSKLPPGTTHIKFSRG